MKKNRLWVSRIGLTLCVGVIVALVLSAPAAGRYSARGAGGHYILVVPRHALVIVHRVNPRGLPHGTPKHAAVCEGGRTRPVVPVPAPGSEIRARALLQNLGEGIDLLEHGVDVGRHADALVVLPLDGCDDDAVPGQKNSTSFEQSTASSPTLPRPHDCAGSARVDADRGLLDPTRPAVLRGATGGLLGRCRRKARAWQWR